MADVPMQEAAAPAAAAAQAEGGAGRGKERKERARKEDGAKGKAKDDKAREKEKAAQKRKREGEASGEKSEKAEPEFACRLKYRNTLPELPFDPKLRTIPLDPMRHVRYRITSIENLYRFPVLTEPDLGIPIDLLDPDTYRLPPNKPPLAAEDVALLVKPSSDKVETPRVSVQWLRKHQYITHDYSLEKLYTRGRQDAGRAAVRAADPLTHRDREAQLEAIERGFEAAKRPPVHATNPKLTAVEVLDVLPALELWGSSFNHVIFDTSPIPNPPHPSDADYAQKVAAGEALVRRSVLKGYSERSTAEKFTVLYVPKPADDADAKAASLFGDDNDEAGAKQEELEWVRKYNYKIDSSVKDCFILAPHPEKGTITFMPLDTKVTLTKSSVPASEKPTRVTLVRQAITDEEKAQRQTRIAGFLEG